MRDRFQAGTGVRREFDLPKIREGMKDHRHWVSYGFVASVGDDGGPDDSDTNAVLVAPRGVMVDVVLSPSDEPCTCRYAGIQGGPTVTIYAPIHPGDEVLVVQPDGELGLPPVIVAIMNSKVAKLPIEGDGKPVFRNDRLSIFARGVPIEVRNDAGANVRLEADGAISLVPANGKTVDVGGTSGLQGAGLGDTLQIFADNLVNRFNTHTHLGVTTGGGTSGIPAPAFIVPPAPTLASDTVKIKP